MSVHDYVRLVAGALVTGSVVSGLLVHPGFFALAIFVGLNLLQSAFTGSCPLMALLRRAGVPESRSRRAAGGHHG